MLIAARWFAIIWLVLLAIYCAVALLFTAGGRDLAGPGSVLFIWFGAIGSAAAVLLLMQGKPAGRWLGIAVYAFGAACFLIEAVISRLPFSDHVFFIALGAANILGALALYKAPNESFP